MTAPTTTGPAGASGTTPPAAAGPRHHPSRVRALAADTFAGTPGRLRLLGGLAVVTALLFGAIGFVAADGLHADISHARSNAAQLVRVQTILTSLVQADANATNAFLVGGVEPAAEATAYADGIATASRTLAEASSANPADAATLGTVNRALATYTGLIESARANNRQGFPIGAAYLRQASTTLQQDAIPPLASLVSIEQRRVNDSTSAGATAHGLLVAILLVALIALAVLQLWLFRKTHRMLNPSLVVATACILVVGVVGLGVVAWSKSQTDKVHAGAYDQTVDLATARIEGFDAKSAEALTLINRGNGQDYEALFQSVSTAAGNALTDGLTLASPGVEEYDTVDAFTTYLAAHKKVRALDDGGNWDQAVAMATGSGAANRDFAAFQTASALALDAHAGQLSHSLNQARLPLTALSWLLLLAGLVAAAATWRGTERRLREYR